MLMTPQLKLERAREIDGWMSEAELEFLAKTARNSDYILEFGCYKGRSTRALADNCPGIVFAVDPWGLPYYNDNESQANWIDTENSWGFFQENLKEHLDTKKVIPVRDYSWAFKSPIRFNFIFIDGDHRYEQVKDDINIALKYACSTGIIAGHDYGRSDWPGVKKAVDECFPVIETVETIWYVRL